MLYLAIQMGPFRPVSVFLLLCLCYLCTCSVQSRRIVKHLPGYNGPLPFYLETGYVMVDEVNECELFYYFIKSEGNPSEDPLILWLTGGNRCSALSGLIFEIGPLKIVKALYNGSIPELEYHPHAWTKNASIIFLDSPLGAGFSYSSNPKGYEVGDTVASLQIHKFLMQWFVDHPQYLTLPFYVNAGDSYAGKIVPFVAQLISEGIREDTRSDELGSAPDGGRGGKEQQILGAEVKTLEIWLAQTNSHASEEKNRRESEGE